MKKVSIGIIGAGRIGQLHAENILHHLPHFNLKAVTDPHLNIDWVKANKIPQYGDEADLIMTDPDIDAVLIASPAPTHIPLIIQAAKAKKHIFCEKPIALNIEEIRQALEVVKAAGVKLQIGFNRRFDAQFLKVAQTVREGKLGPVHLIRLTFRDPKPPPLEYVAQSGGIFLDMSIHDFDMARFVSHDEITEVFAMGSTLINPEFARYDDVDTAVIQLKFKNGALGVIDNSRQTAYGYDQRVEVLGSQGCMITDNNTPTRVSVNDSRGVCFDNPLYFFLDRYAESYREELRCFYNSIINDQPCLVNGRDGLISIIIGMAAKQSLKEHRPITIPLETE